VNLRFTVTAACAGCGACLLTCPERAIRVAGPEGVAPLAVLDTCTGCGECAEVCPAEACVPVRPPVQAPVGVDR
jgi:Pyruvate/2-oxoacid:ferredoxin oxidoreductase delta subunit